MYLICEPELSFFPWKNLMGRLPLYMVRLNYAISTSSILGCLKKLPYKPNIWFIMDWLWGIAQTPTSSYILIGKRWLHDHIYLQCDLLSCRVLLYINITVVSLEVRIKALYLISILLTFLEYGDVLKVSGRRGHNQQSSFFCMCACLSVRLRCHMIITSHRYF